MPEKNHNKSLRIIRLDRYLSESGFGTRSEVKRIILNGWVSVDKEIVKNPAVHVKPEIQEVEVGEEKAESEEFVYLALNKPAGYVSAIKDKRHPPVTDLVAAEWGHRNLVPVGRLDIDTTGLLLITNDGCFLHDVTSPRHGVEKEYEVVLEKEVDDEYVLRFATGIKDGNEVYKTAVLKVLEPKRCLLTISEGKYHQVKNMFLAVGNKVVQLKRTAIGKLRLDSLELTEGKYKEIKAVDIY